jgi:acetyl esterase/lipase
MKSFHSLPFVLVLLLMGAIISITVSLPATAAELKASDYFAAKDYSQTVTFPTDVTMRTITYSTLPGYRPLTMDVYLPAGETMHPGLIFFHGGSFVGGDKRVDPPFGNFPGLLAALAAHDYVVASPDYRLSGEAHFPAALIDVKTAIRFLRAHASDFHLDSSHIAAWGASAGGYLAVMTGLTCGVSSLEPQPAIQSSGAPSSECVQAVVDWSGFLVLDHMFTDLGKPMPENSQEGAFLGCEPAVCSLDVLSAANPMTFITSKAPPFLIQHGDADTILAQKQPRDLYDSLRAKNVPAEFVVYHGAGHMFMLPGKRGADAGDPVNDQAVLDKVEQFLDSTLKPKK